jgi:hypothetical protein
MYQWVQTQTQQGDDIEYRYEQQWSEIHHSSSGYAN